MSMSGITPTEECVTSYNEMQIKKKYGYLIMKIKDEKKVAIEEKGDPFPTDQPQSKNKEEFDKVKAKFLAEECEPRFLLFDFKLDTKDGRREKIVFINWCSDSCPVKKRTLQGSTTVDLTKVFSGLGVTLQCNDADELDYNSIASEVVKAK